MAKTYIGYVEDIYEDGIIFRKTRHLCFKCAITLAMSGSEIRMTSTDYESIRCEECKRDAVYEINI